MLVFSGKKLRELREAKGWTQEQLSDYSGISRQQISFYELEAIVPGANKLGAIANAIQCPVDQMFEERETDDRESA